MRTGDLVGSDLPLQTMGDENWATRSQAEVDGIEGSRVSPWTQQSTVIAGPMLSLRGGHPLFCSVCLNDGDPFDVMRVKPMTPAIVACRPYSWLA